jgi:hypothetical protein
MCYWNVKGKMGHDLSNEDVKVLHVPFADSTLIIDIALSDTAQTRNLRLSTWKTAEPLASCHCQSSAVSRP